jgi:hypothetical protein
MVKGHLWGTLFMLALIVPYACYQVKIHDNLSGKGSHIRKETSNIELSPYNCVKMMVAFSKK